MIARCSGRVPDLAETEIVNKLNTPLSDPEKRAWLEALCGVAVSLTPDEFGKFIADETEKWALTETLVCVTAKELDRYQHRYSLFNRPWSVRPSIFFFHRAPAARTNKKSAPRAGNLPRVFVGERLVVSQRARRTKSPRGRKS